MSITIARECHGIIDISGIHLRLVKIALPNIQKLNCMFMLDQITEIINPYQIPFLLNHVILDQVKLMMTILLLRDLWYYIVTQTVLP